MRSDLLEFLQGVPKHRTLSVDGCGIYVCHGSPAGQTEPLLEQDSLDRFRRQREIANTDIVVFGRTHLPFARLVDGTLFVNPGSVGVELGRATYAVVSTEEEPWSAEIRSVEYDAARLRERLQQWGLPSLWEPG
jgi:predicted phosphodiesterase